MNSSEKKFLITSLAGVLLYLVATLWFLSQPGCVMTPKGPVIDAAAIVDCATVAQRCFDNIQYAKAGGDSLELSNVTLQCANEWVTTGCQKLIKETVGSL